MSVIYGKFDPSEYNSNTFFLVDGHLSNDFAFPKSRLAVVLSGERAKTISFVKHLVTALSNAGITRDGTLVVVGGGALLDVGGFVASVYMRGIKLVKVPTTLLSVVDGAIGGKNAINVGRVKNLVGSFYNANVIIDYSLLRTLPTKQITDGYGEIIKYSLLTPTVDAEYDFDGSLPEEKLIKACIDYKLSVTAEDYFDKSLRHKLNVGHTLAHALELNGKLSHGEAVAHGIYYESEISCYLGYMSQPYLAHVQERVTDVFEIAPLKAKNKIAELCLKDKKNSFENITLELLSGNYEVREVQLSFREMSEILKCL